MKNQFFKKLKNFIIDTFKEEPYTIVSLGPNCYPRTVLTRTKLIKKKINGRLTMPFDFAWYHSAKYVTEFLQNDFENYFADLHFSDFCNAWDSGTKINFSHEAYLGKDKKNSLIKIYQKRIDNFRKEIQKDKPILFLQIIKDEKVGEDCKNTFSVLKNICKEKKFAYVVIDCTKTIEPSKIPLEIYLTRISLPNNNQDVFSEKFYNSEDGKIIEKKIAKFVENVIIKEFNVDVVTFS